MRGAELMVRCLEEEGIKYIFGVPGEENIAFMDALLDSDIEFITTRQETGAAYMAGTMGRLTGKPGVSLSTLGPGATNMMTGVANSNMDLSPLIAITGQADLERQHKESHQYYDLKAMYAPVTKWNASVLDPDIIPEIVKKAYYVATAEKPGATHIVLPEDIADMDVKASPLKQTEHTLSEAGNTVIQKAAEQIKNAERPLIIAGNGVTRCGAADELKELAEKLQVHVTHTFMGKGAIPFTNELSLLTSGLGGKDYINCGFEYADLIIAVGFDMVEYPPKNWNPDGETPVLHIDTKEADIDENYPVSLNVVGNIDTNLKRLTEAVEGRAEKDEHYAKLRQDILDELEDYENDEGYPLKPQRIVSDLRDVLGEEDILLSDVGAHKMWISRMYHCYKPNTCLISNGLASMGIALPGAIGAKLAKPDRKVLAVAGDGSYLMNGEELETAVRLNLPIVVMIWRDNGYGLIGWHQEKAYDRKSNVEFGNPDFVKLAEAYGATGYRIEEQEDLKPTLEKAFKSDGPVVIECPVDYRENMKLTERLGKVICKN
ncbi:acetolactate synthase large subunit [Pseudalkalibacillus caeni]|uniref:Acetolactate synthase large subunit n=1 Tax=Exobacillus caeni TaxID=2574798 RepID=A0A5R9EXC7_9BACL|nr:acetolactate synthase large subunit [Pseudalkalibacillus caeni]TLS35737.1 acetolactate synthase large subunit [Pseudalkalibacillus caeni]